MLHELRRLANHRVPLAAQESPRQRDLERVSRLRHQAQSTGKWRSSTAAGVHRMWGLEIFSSRSDTQLKWPMVSQAVAVAHVANSFHLMDVGLALLGRQPSARSVHMVGLQQPQLLQRLLARAVQAKASASLHRRWLRPLQLIPLDGALLPLDNSRVLG